MKSNDRTTVLESSIGERVSVRCHFSLAEATTVAVDSTLDVLDAILPIAQSTTRPPKMQPVTCFLSNATTRLQTLRMILIVRGHINGRARIWRV